MLHINSIVWCQLVLTVPSQIMQPIQFTAVLQRYVTYMVNSTCCARVMWGCGLGSLVVRSLNGGVVSAASPQTIIVSFSGGVVSAASPQTIIVSFSGGVVSASSTSDYYCVIEWRCGLGSLDLRLLLCHLVEVWSRHPRPQTIIVSLSGGVVSAASTSDYYCVI